MLDDDHRQPSRVFFFSHSTASFIHLTTGIEVFYNHPVTQKYLPNGAEKQTNHKAASGTLILFS